MAVVVACRRVEEQRRVEATKVNPLSPYYTVPSLPLMFWQEDGYYNMKIITPLNGEDTSKKFNKIAHLFTNKYYRGRLLQRQTWSFGCISRRTTKRFTWSNKIALFRDSESCKVVRSYIENKIKMINPLNGKETTIAVIAE